MSALPLSKAPYKALLVGHIYELTTAPAFTLQKAGFEIDLICPGITNSTERFRTIPVVDQSVVLTAAQRISERPYDLIVLGDDRTIGEIVDANIPNETKLALLPVSSFEHFTHLYSKCALSTVLARAKIRTPPFAICNNSQELESQANILGYPVMIKIDRSGGGEGIFECHTSLEVLTKATTLPYPALLQKKITGKTVDLSAFYQNQDLIYFSHSIFHRSNVSQYGPSCVRRYTQVGALPPEIADELWALGVALGADGFANVTCIEEVSTGYRFYIEADMRPNGWIDYGRFIGSEPAKPICNYFVNGASLQIPVSIHPDFAHQRLIAFPDRIALWEVALNRYGSWQSFDNVQSLLEHIKFRVDFGLRKVCRRYLKPILPSKIWKFSAAHYHALYTHLQFHKWTLQNLSYVLDSKFRSVCSLYLKPYIPKSIWQKLKRKYRKLPQRNQTSIT